jgi:hypothetical protein
MTAVKVKDATGQIKYFEVVGAGTELDPFRPIHQVMFPSPMPITFEFPAVQAISGSVNISNFPSSQVISGSVNVGNFPEIQAVSGGITVLNFPTTQTVDGSVNVANFPTTQTVAGSVSIANFPTTQTVAGSVSIANFPTTQTVAGSVSIANFPASLASSSDIQALGDRLPVSLGQKSSTNSLSVTLSNDGLFATSFGNSVDAVAANDTGYFSFIGLLKRLLSIKLDLKLSDLAAYLQSIVTAMPSATKPVLVRSLAKNWREDFNGTSLSSSDWQVVQTGSGQSIAVASSELRITSGTTVSSETIVRTSATFTIPFRTVFSYYLSQRIANQEVYLEVVDVTGSHYARWLLSGTSATLGYYATANSGNSISIGSLTINSSNAYTALEIELSPDEINFYPRATDSISNRYTGGVRTRQIPDPSLDYYLQIRVKNLSTAPASSTTVFIDCITIQDIEELTAEITAGRGGGGANQAIPVVFPNAQTVSVSNSVAIGSMPSVSIGNSYLPISSYVATAITSVTPLAANATYTAASFISKEKLKGWVVTDQSGTLIPEFSRDNTTWRQPTASISINAGTTAINFECLGIYSRVRYVNGATAQGSFELALISIG